MRKKFLSVMILCGFLVGVSSWAFAEPSTVDGAQKATVQLDAKGLRALAKALLDNKASGRTVCIVDSFGHQWELTINRWSITGWFYPVCYESPWPVTGVHVGLNFDLVAGPNPDHACYCNEWHEFVGTVNLQTRSAEGWAYAYGGEDCTGDAPCSAWLCQ